MGINFRMLLIVATFIDSPNTASPCEIHKVNHLERWPRFNRPMTWNVGQS